MLLISTTHKPATDLGFLLHKNPDRNFVSNLTFGKVRVVYPEASEERTTAAVLIEFDTVSLVRGKGEAHGSLDQYVNDRPYVASSFLSVALAEAFGTAMSGRSKERPDLAEAAIPLELRLPVLPSRKGAEMIERLFQPLGFEVEATQLDLDEEFPEWGPSAYYDVTLRGTVRLRDALRYLYILLPVLDAKKHYYMDPNEVTKLVSKGEGWLAGHPERNWIVRSSLGSKPSLMREAMDQLANIETTLKVEAEEADDEVPEPEPKKESSLHQQRHERVVEIVRELKPKTLLDLGCGEGKLMRLLMPIKGLQRIVGMDVSYFELEKAKRKLRLEDAGPALKERFQLLHGSLMYRDERLSGFDVCTVIEVIEHLDIPRLRSFERIVFECARPDAVILTTPNREYNAIYQIEDEFRHGDHRFEWTRAEFADWCSSVCERFGYSVRIEGVGAEDPEHGCPSQLAVFTS